MRVKNENDVQNQINVNTCLYEMHEPILHNKL